MTLSGELTEINLDSVFGDITYTIIAEQNEVVRYYDMIHAFALYLYLQHFIYLICSIQRKSEFLFLFSKVCVKN